MTVQPRDVQCERCKSYPYQRLHRRSCIPIEFAVVVREQLAGGARSMRELILACAGRRPVIVADLSWPTIHYLVQVTVSDLRAAGVIVIEGKKKGARYKLA